MEVVALTLALETQTFAVPSVIPLTFMSKYSKSTSAVVPVPEGWVVPKSAENTVAKSPLEPDIAIETCVRVV